MSRAHQSINQDGTPQGILFMCPGCNEYHGIAQIGGSRSTPKGPEWEFNGDYELPTVSPSILVHEIKKDDGTILQPKCHSFVKNGKIEFLSDCGHKLAGQTVDLPQLEKEWL